MKGFKSKASRFFKDAPPQDERAALAEVDGNIDFDAAVQGRKAKHKASRFFLPKTEKTTELPTPRPNIISTTSDSTPDSQLGASDSLDENSLLHTAFQFSEAPIHLAPSSIPSSQPSSTRSSFKPEVDAPKLKPRPSFAALKPKGSRFFRNDFRDSPPPPPVPQIPVDPEALPAPRGLEPLRIHAARGSRSSLTPSEGGRVAISRPIPLPQYCSLPIPENAATVPFTKPDGPRPARPRRPDSLDDETIAFMQQSGMRTVIGPGNRASNSTASSGTPRSHCSSVEARLGLPSGHSTPRTSSLDSPLAARFPLDLSLPLPMRDSTGSVKFSRFSDYVRSQRGGYAGDGVDEEDRELGPIEQFDQSKEGQWTVEKRVSKGPNGNPGMLFRDEAGSFHFVADI
ncbi:hypothetical protein ACEQ8H_002996 [Pleosporales sp. CAS-2024a]